jgi:hypothetical protein
VIEKNNQDNQVPTKDNSFHMAAHNCETAIVYGLYTYGVTGSTPPESVGKCCTTISDVVIEHKTNPKI